MCVAQQLSPDGQASGVVQVSDTLEDSLPPPPDEELDEPPPEPPSPPLVAGPEDEGELQFAASTRQSTACERNIVFSQWLP